MTQWHEFSDAGAVALAAADRIHQQADRAIRDRGEFKLVLAGGTTPRECYKILSKRSLHWDRWKLFYGDERCLPRDDSERNHQMVIATGLSDHVKQHFIMPAELGPVKGAESYRKVLIGEFPFDTVLLGMGEDGHTASLFPGHDIQCDAEGEQVLAVHAAPKPPPERISLSCTCLQECKNMLVMVTGESKRAAVRQWRDGKELPVARVADLRQATVLIEVNSMR